MERCLLTSVVVLVMLAVASSARAAVVCGKEAKLVAHGCKNPIASNAGEKGRERNRRVEITVRHTEAKR